MRTNHLRLSKAPNRSATPWCGSSATRSRQKSTRHSCFKSSTQTQASPGQSSIRACPCSSQGLSNSSETDKACIAIKLPGRAPTSVLVQHQVTKLNKFPLMARISHPTHNLPLTDSRTKLAHCSYIDSKAKHSANWTLISGWTSSELMVMVSLGPSSPIVN